MIGKRFVTHDEQAVMLRNLMKAIRQAGISTNVGGGGGGGGGGTIPNASAANQVMNSSAGLTWTATATPTLTGLTLTDLLVIANGTISRDVNGLIDGAVVGSRTITINRNVDGLIIGWEDAGYEWTLTRDGDGNITEWSCVAK